MSEPKPESPLDALRANTRLWRLPIAATIVLGIGVALPGSAAVPQTDDLRRKKIRRRDLVALLEEAVPVDVGAQMHRDVRFAATVALVDEHGARWAFTIVGEDDAEPGRGRIGWVSPLAREPIGRRPGEYVVWRRPQGALALELVDLRYEGEPPAGG